MLGSLFGDTVTYKNDILMFKRTKTLENIKFEGFIQLLGKLQIWS